MNLKVEEIGLCKELQQIIENIQTNKTLNSKQQNDLLSPFASLLWKHSKGETISFIEKSLINSFYNGVGSVLGIVNKPFN